MIDIFVTAQAVLFTILLSFFIIVLKRDKRTLYSGVFFVLTLLSGGLLLTFLVLSFSEVISNNPILFGIIVILSVLMIIALLLFPMILVVMLLYNGVKIVRREGLKPRNLLTLGVLILIYLYPLLFPNIDSIVNSKIWVILPWVSERTKESIAIFIPPCINFVAFYIIYLMFMYTVTNIINLINFRVKNLDYVVVLGAGLIGDRVTPLLASRIDRGIEVYKKNPNSKLIMSGGQGSDEKIPEGVAMAKYAIEKGIPEEDIIIEDKSTTTRENILFSKALMEKENPKFAIATNSYHVFRGLMLAKSLGIKCIGYGSKTKWYFALNAFIREFIAYLSYTKKKHIIFLGIIFLIYAGLFISFDDMIYTIYKSITNV